MLKTKPLKLTVSFNMPEDQKTTLGTSKRQVAIGSLILLKVSERLTVAYQQARKPMNDNHMDVIQ